MSRIDIEHIALRASDIAPAQFAWRHYPDRIDLRKVQYALKDESSRPWPRVAGNLREGYQLTPEGLRWAQSENESYEDSGTDAGGKSVFTKLEAERHRLRNSQAFKKVVSGMSETVTRQDFYAFVRINDYFPTPLRAERFVKMRNVVKGDEPLESAWDWLFETFGGGTDD